MAVTVVYKNLIKPACYINCIHFKTHNWTASFRLLHHSQSTQPEINVLPSPVLQSAFMTEYYEYKAMDQTEWSLGEDIILSPEEPLTPFLLILI